MTVAFPPGWMNAISEGRMRASTNNVSFDGTISIRSIPGCMTAPMVLTSTWFTVPSTGDLTVVRLTRSSRATLDMFKRLSSVLASFNSAWVALRNCCLLSAIFWLASATAASDPGMAMPVSSSCPRESLTAACNLSSSTCETAPLSTNGAVISSSFSASTALRVSLFFAALSSARPCSYWVRCCLSILSDDSSSCCRDVYRRISSSSMPWCSSEKLGIEVNGISSISASSLATLARSV